MPDYLILFVVGLVTSFASNVSGGGAALILLPVLYWLGLNPIDAIGTMMIGAIGLIIGSTLSRDARATVRRDHLLPMIVIIIAASIIGPLITINLSPTVVKAIIGTMILITATVGLMVLKKPSHSREVSHRSRYTGYSLYFISSTLLAAFSSGIGLISNYILIGLVGMSPLETVTTRRVVGLVGVPIQLVIFTLSGHVNIKFGLVLAIGNFIGAYFGINYAIKKGNDFIKKAMAITAIILVVTIFI